RQKRSCPRIVHRAWSTRRILIRSRPPITTAIQAPADSCPDCLESFLGTGYRAAGAHGRTEGAMFRDADLGVRPCDIDAHALHAMILDRCRRPLGHEMKNAVRRMYAGIEVLAKSLAAGPAARVSPEQCVMLLRQQLDGLQTTLGRILDDVAPERTATQTFDAAAVLRDLARFLSTDAAVAGVKLRLAL